jgi:hypothetical protein
MLENITHCLDNSLLDDNHSQLAMALFSFYNSPPPPSHQYRMNVLWVMSTDFNSMYREMETLLVEKIPTTKRAATLTTRRVRAANLALEVWKKGYFFDPLTHQPQIVPIPLPKSATAEQLQLRKAAIAATWKNGSRNS